MVRIYRSSLAAAVLLAVFTAACSDASPTREKPVNTGFQRTRQARIVKTAPPPKATDLDPNAMDEALRQALVDLRNRFRCNSISGCKAHTVLVNFGERARGPLQQLFPTASRQMQWRARIVRIIAEMQLPTGRAFLRKTLRDRSDKARAYAVYGLALLDDHRDQEMMHNYANAPGIIASAMTRVAAAWGLAFLGEEVYAKRFVALVHEAAAHQLGGATLRWALELCRVPLGPSCAGTLEAAARHPSYVVRREVLRSVNQSPASARALVILAADPNVNIARRAEEALGKLSGRGDVRGAVAWRAWLEERSGVPANR